MINIGECMLSSVLTFADDTKTYIKVLTLKVGENYYSMTSTRQQYRLKNG